jgi:hypothetical protein
MKQILSVLLVMGLAASSSATIINIPADCPTIQQGIDAGDDGDTVIVQPGTYPENIDFRGHNIVLASLFLTTADTSYISKTIIDGNSSGRVVAFTSGENGSAMLIGFTITNGDDRLAAGIYCKSSSPRISNNIIKGNRAYY